jgi:hypothetical protein
MKLSKSPTNVLLLLVGVSPRTVEGEQFAEVRLRYVTLALVTIMVSLLAGNSMGFAVYTLTQSGKAYFIAGTVWFMVILTIESFLIVSLKPNLTLASISAIVMRFMMAILISQLVAVPAELYIFRREILNERSKVSEHEVTEGINQFTEEYKPQLDALEVQRESLTKKIEDKEAECQSKYDAYIKEWKGDKAPGFSGVPGSGPWTELNRKQYNLCKEQLDAEKNEEIKDSKASHLKAVTDQIAKVKGERDARIEEREQAIKAGGGLLAQIEALHRITEQSSEAKFKVWLLRLFIIVLETLPLTGKLFMVFSPFDRFRLLKENMTLQSEMKKIRAESEKKRQQAVTRLAETLREQEFSRAFTNAAYSGAERSDKYSGALRQRAEEILSGLNSRPKTETVEAPVGGRPASNGHASGVSNGNGKR